MAWVGLQIVSMKMSLAIPLEHYRQTVLTCLYPATWERLTAIRPDSVGWLVMVSDRHQPVGAIAYHRLFAFLWERSRAFSALHFPESLPSFSPLSGEMAGLVEPFPVFSAHTSVQEFLTQISPQPHSPYGLVDGEGRFLGLVNCWQILGEMAVFSREQEFSRGQAKEMGITELSKILDPFPIPLRLQNASETTIFQNVRWREDIEQQCLLSDFNRWQLKNESSAPLSCSQWLEQRSPQDRGLTQPLRSPRNHRIWQFTRCPLAVGAADWLTIALDITDLQQSTQTLIAQNQEIIEINSLKDRFLANICHELKSPATTLVGLASLLREGASGLLGDRQAQYVDLLVQNGRRVMTQVNILRDLLEAETPTLSVNWSTVSIPDLCEQVLQVIADRYSDRSPPTLNLAEDIGEWMTDGLCLKQILSYLLENIMRSTAEPTNHEINVDCSGQWLEFTIQTRENSPREFRWETIEPSWSAGSAKLPKELEFGVILVSKWVHSLGGELFWETRQVYAFRVALPNIQTSSRVRSEGTPSKGWVLVGDICPERLEALQSLLPRLGYAVLVARNGLEVIDRARCLQPKYIFLHPDLPQLSGWDVLTLLKSTESTRHIPIVLTEDSPDRPFSLPFSEDFTLTPPFSLDNLNPILNAVPPIAPPPRSLSILQLFPESELDNAPASNGIQPTPNAVSNFPLALTLVGQVPLNHRILEADDLEQAEMLAQVWEIDVVVLDGRRLQNPQQYLLELSRCHGLTSLPFVILDAPTAEVANTMPALLVFPCLLPEINSDLEQFLQVLQVATGMGAEAIAIPQPKG